MNLPIKNPRPDIKRFIDVITGKTVPPKPPFAELFLDYEIAATIGKDYLSIDWVHPSEDKDSVRVYWDNTTEVYYRLGYEYIRISEGIDFPGKNRIADDTAALSRGKRGWSEEGTGMISSWEDFEKYPWPSLDKFDVWHYEYVSKRVPEGMGVFVCPTSGFLEVPKETLLGYENLSYLLYDDPELVKAVIDRVGELICGFYEKLIGLPKLAGFFQGDDMGFKSSTLISPEALREYILPWHKKLAKLAHDNGLIYMLHCCGNVESIMEEPLRRTLF